MSKNDPFNVPPFPARTSRIHDAKISRGDHRSFALVDGFVYQLGVNHWALDLSESHRINDSDRRAWARLAGFKTDDLRKMVKDRRDRSLAKQKADDLKSQIEALTEQGYTVTKRGRKK